MTSVAQKTDSSSNAAVAIGNFDGVHVGHQKLLRQVVRLAKERALRPLLMTFAPHPVAVLGRTPPEVLTTVEAKCTIIRELHPELSVHVETFDLKLAACSPAEFVKNVLVEGVSARAVVVGRNFRFGKGRAGDFDVLKRLGAGFGLEAMAAELVSVDGEVVSSSRLRRAVSEGDVTLAGKLLGRPHAVIGKVGHGQARGRDLGFPTANLMDTEELLPADGVYAGYLSGSAETCLARPAPCVVNIGRRPTVGGQERQLEAHVLDFSGDLYGERLKLEFVDRLRDEKRFETLPALVEQIQRDIERARELLGTAR